MNLSLKSNNPLFRDKILRARNTPLEKKLLAGAELYEYARSIMMIGIRHQLADASAEDQYAKFQRRLPIAR